MTGTHLAFEVTEYQDRLARAKTLMQQQGVDALVLFAQESMFYLTGYDTTGYSKFQAMVLMPDRQPALLTRSADLRQARLTSIVEDIRLWVDRDGADPGTELAGLLNDLGLQGKRLGIELSAWTIVASRWEKVRAALDGFATWRDVSLPLSRLRLVKSPAEIACVRKAAEFADIALDAAHQTIAAGVPENEVLAAMLSRQIAAGGDTSASQWILGSGPRALLCRSVSGYGIIASPDQVTLEWAGICRHYHVPMMRTVVVGSASRQHRHMHAAGIEALAACQAECRPGRTFGDVFAAHARVLDQAGLGEHRLNACGYSVGAQYPPTWMGPEEPMFYEANPLEIQPGMTLFMHMILMDSQTVTAMCPGETVLVGADGPERLSRHSLDLVVLD